MSSESPAARSTHPGLYAGGQSVPLQGVSVRATLRDVAASVTITQRYRNSEPRPIEAVYVFPVDDAAAVCGFEAWIGDRHIVGKVDERERAFVQYDDAMIAGHGAFLLDQETPDVFTVRIGNIAPGEEAVLRITYVTELGMEGDAIRFVLPTTVSPRYAPEADHRGIGETLADRVNPPVAPAVEYELDLDMDLEMSSDITGIASPSHSLQVETNGRRGRIRLGSRTCPLDRDLVLHVALAAGAGPRAVIERTPSGETAVMVSWVPRVTGGESRVEAIFLVDCSGSMDGSSIAEVRQALQLCLRSLPSGSRFNIVRFGSSHEALFPESREYDEASLAEASRYVEDMRADLGGTEILPALQRLLERKSDDGFSRELIVFTDGQVSNTSAVISLVRRHARRTRVFAFGIGAGASRHLVNGLARAGRGFAEFIAPRERIEPKVLRQFQKVLSPALTNVRIDWAGLRATQAPHHVPAIFDGSRLVAYSFIEELRPTDITLLATAPDGDVAWRVALNPAEAVPGSAVATLTAKALIRDLEEDASPLHDPDKALTQADLTSRVRQEIVRLATMYSLCSRETSFVGVVEREHPIEEEAEVRRIPIALTSQWGGMDGQAFPTMFRVMRAPAGLGSFTGAYRAIETVDKRLEETAFASYLSSGMPARASWTQRPLDQLVRLQRADGSWWLTPELLTIVGVTHDAIAAVVGTLGDDRSFRAGALATALALVWLETHAADAKDEWELLAEKARQHLDRLSTTSMPRESWFAVAHELLGRPAERITSP